MDNNGNGHDAWTADQILAFDDSKTEDVVVPEWGGKSFQVRGLTSREKDSYEAGMRIKNDKGEYDINMTNYRAKLVAMTMIKADGSRLFEMIQVQALGGKSASAIGRLHAVAERLSGYEKGQVDALVKNSEADQEESSVIA